MIQNLFKLNVGETALSGSIILEIMALPIFTVVAYFLPRLPNSIFDKVKALPYHLYVLATSGTNIDKARPIAYSTAVVLIAIVLLSKTAATVIRMRLNKRNRN